MQEYIENKYYSHFHNFYYSIINFSKLNKINKLPELQFQDLRQLLESSPINTEDGIILRKLILEESILSNILNCMSIFANHKSDIVDNIDHLNASIQSLAIDSTKGQSSKNKSHIYWAKGSEYKNSLRLLEVDDIFTKKKHEEKQVTLIFELLSSLINPGDQKLSTENLKLPSLLDDFQKSCITHVLCSYLRNDSVLDIAKHIPLYRAVLKFLRAIAVSPQLISLLTAKQENNTANIIILLYDLETCINDYANKKFKAQRTNKSTDDNDDDELELLIKDIQETAAVIKSVTYTNDEIDEEKSQITSIVKYEYGSSLETKYLAAMKDLQFDSFELVVESEKGCQLTMPYHYKDIIEREQISIGRGNSKKMKRINQELVNLEKSLPLSFKSSIFLRYDTNRPDLMKALIIGPPNTPYANGCFEFDIYFPSDYPNLPMKVAFPAGIWYFSPSMIRLNLNPNFHPNGTVCLSILNTWHGPLDVLWNAETSSLLQILVTIQSFVLVSEPFFNEPGYERIRGTPEGNISSRSYNSEVRFNCVSKAMYHQLLHPSPCFKDVIQQHFWFKQNEICEQIDKWIVELDHQASIESVSIKNLASFKTLYELLKSEFQKLPVP